MTPEELPVKKASAKSKKSGTTQPTAEGFAVPRPPSQPGPNASPRVGKSTSNSNSIDAAASPSQTSTSGSKSREIPTGRVEGPTSIAFLLHTASAIPRKIVETYDLKHHTSWLITTDEGDGIIHVSNPPPSSTFGAADSPAGGEAQHKRESSDGKSILTAELISDLVNTYFDHVNPLFPIVSKSEFCGEPNPPPLLLYAMAGVAATRRGTPKRVFDAIRTIINGIIRNNDVLSDSTFHNVQALVSYRVSCSSR